MSNKEINFLAEGKSQDYQEREKFFKKLRQVGLVLAIALFVLAASYGYTIYLTNQRRRLTRQEDSLQSRLEGVEDKIGLLLFLKERLNKIGQITLEKDKQSMVDKFAVFWDSLPEGVSLTEATVGEERIEVNGQGDMLSISTLAEKYTNRQDNYRSAQLGSLTKNEDKEDWFDFTLTIQF